MSISHKKLYKKIRHPIARKSIVYLMNVRPLNYIYVYLREPQME
jgi:hypothetical protein